MATFSRGWELSPGQCPRPGGPAPSPALRPGPSGPCRPGRRSARPARLRAASPPQTRPLRPPRSQMGPAPGRAGPETAWSPRGGLPRGGDRHPGTHIPLPSLWSWAAGEGTRSRGCEAARGSREPPARGGLRGRGPLATSPDPRGRGTPGRCRGCQARPHPLFPRARSPRRLTWPRRSSSSSGGSAQRSPGERGGGRASRAAGFMPRAPWNVPGTREPGPAVCPSSGALVAASGRRLRLLLLQPVRLVPAPPAPGFPGDRAAAAAAAATRRSLARLQRGGRVPGRVGASRGGASGAHPPRAAPRSRLRRPRRLPLPPPRVMRLGLQGAAASAQPPPFPLPL